MPRTITPTTTVEHARKEAKRWLKALRANDRDARHRFERAYPSAPVHPVLRDTQHALAREYDCENWVALKQAIAKVGTEGSAAAWQPHTRDEYERLANDWVLANDAQDQDALGRLNGYYRRSFSFEDLRAEIWRRVYAFRQRSSRVPKNYLQPTEAQTLIAQDEGFGSWSALMQAITIGGPRVPAYAIHETENAIGPRRQLTDREWDEIISVMKERRITALHANGLMTDAVLARIADLDHVTALDLSGSRQLSDESLQHLRRMPQLKHLNLTGFPAGKLTDRGLQVLCDLPNLQSFEMTWQRGITDAGVVHLKCCDQIERVHLMGSETGDGAIEAMQGKLKLRSLSTGKLVTDAGLQLLDHCPTLTDWRSDEDAVRLVIDGPFTNKGLASLAGLKGVGDLDLFWHVTGITSDGFAYLVDLPHLVSLGADGALSDDAAMKHIAKLPQLRRLRVQETVATDAGFESLSRSDTIESVWGRDCAHLGNRGFVALSRMPALRGLGVTCKNVDDEALSALPRFPALRELTPIGMRDAGFRHIGACERLERLTCMYCRETTDAATEHLVRLPLKYYYAGLTLITDRSLEILGGIASLETIELYECKGITNAGLKYLRDLPQLREVQLDGLPGVTFEGTRTFPRHVRVRYST